ncbi:MAG: aminopeptidase [Blastocatellia bacterium]|nr:aminopeptidase [Blastocatellia bacterium]
MVPAQQSKDFARLAIEGARKVLTECISLKTGDVLALFWDETTADTAQLFLKVARDLGIAARPRYVTLEEQTGFSLNDGVSGEDREALDSARGIITCLSNQVAGTAYRTELLRFGTDGGKRFGHMPGANLSVLAHAVNIDYLEASSRCDDLALALTLGEAARLQTYVLGADGSTEESYDLNFQIGGLLRSPITSTGIIPLGTWGNLPGGETFIAPVEDSAAGIFVLNGAFKEHVIKPPARLLLHFEKGRLVRVEGTRDEEAAFNAILDFARSRGDSYYDSMAELGIGVNPGIKELTGNALFDEKCYGTAHIAIGDSSRYGGLYSSCIHEDLISRGPSLWVDGEPILSKGKDAFDPLQWRETLDECVLGCEPLDPDCVVARTVIAAEKGAYGRLRVRRHVSAGRVGIYHIGEASTSRLLAQLYSMIPPLGRRIKLEELCRKSEEDLQLPVSLTTAAISILLRHGVITVRAAGTDQGEINHE